MGSHRRLRLTDLTTNDIAGWRATRRVVLAVPVGSCEQHGPHLPLGTDAIIARALADGLADARPDVIVSPTISVSASGEHAGFAGTLSLGTEATTLALVELSRSATWADGLVLVNGHGGNVEAVRAAVTLIRAEGRPVHSWWPNVPDGDAHAGHSETSIMLAVRPDLVRMADAAPGNTTPIDALRADLRRSGVAAVSTSGVLGDPTTATLEAGRLLVDRLTADLVASCETACSTWGDSPR
ncbi:mycofactocin biosynthesis peptidyl-dipeptidase MftE [soil metagenome]